MKNRQERQINSIVNTAAFIRENRRRFPELRLLGPRLDAHAERLTKLSTDDYSTGTVLRGDADGEKLRGLAVDIRRKHLIPIVRAGKKLFRFTPDIEGVLVVPATRATPGEIAKSSRAILKAIRSHRKLFTEIGFEPGFADECARMTRELEGLVASRDRYRDARPGVVKALNAEIAAARKVIGVMDALLMHRLGSDLQLAREWRMTMRVGKRIGRPPKPRRRGPPPA